jgi:carboxymethylenebutenolidase
MLGYTDISQPPKDLPAIITRQVAPGISSLLPLSRRGRGPGMIILVDDDSDHVQTYVKGIPSVFIKWAEEGYTVVGIAESALVNKENALKQAVEALFKCEECTPREKVGVVGVWNLIYMHKFASSMD